MSYSIEVSSDGCYEGTSCLINKLDIRDEELLKNTEGAITLAKINYLKKFHLIFVKVRRIIYNGTVLCRTRNYKDIGNRCI